MGRIKRIHVNQHVIRANCKNGETNPVFTVKCGGKTYKAKDVEWEGHSELVYQPDNPLSCGAKVWIETRDTILLDGEELT
jgi:hypothetical protein